MFKYLLFKNGKQIHSSNYMSRLEAFKMDDRLRDLRDGKEAAKYEVKDISKEEGFQQGLY